jgi:cytochrome c peroxidase
MQVLSVLYFNRYRFGVTMPRFVGRLVLSLLIFSGGLCTTAQAFEPFRPFQPLPESPPIPHDNPQSAARITLGKMLFFDRRLSVNGSLSCNSCHDLSRGGADFRPLSTGATGITGRRAAPTLWNVAYQTVLFWDGRAESLEQALSSHLIDKTVMAMPSSQAVVDSISRVDTYVELFANSFADDAVSYQNIKRALASFIRSLRTPNSAFDRYLKGDKQALSGAAQRGFKTFVDTGCASCHFWVNLSGPVPGLAFKMGEGFYELFPNYPGSAYESRYHLSDDLGRYYVTDDPDDRRLWRVPVLRNIALTAPYFHNGSVASLDEAIRVMARTQLGKELSEHQVEDVAAFLGTLTGEFPVISLPQLP